MYIFIVGVSCVGKSTIGNRLAEKIDFLFFDLDDEIEDFFGRSIEQIQNQYLSGYSYREQGAKVLNKIIDTSKNNDLVVALTPKGLHDWYYRLIKKSGAIVIELKDTPENILDRIVFYLGHKAEAIKVLKFFLEKLEGGTSPSDDIPDDVWGKDGPSDDDIPF